MEINQKILELNLRNDEMKALEQQLMLIESQAANIKQVVSDLEDMKGKDKNILASIGNGVFARARVTDSKNIFINIGAGCVVEKDIEEAKKIINKQISELDNIKETARKEIEKRSESLAELENEMRIMQAKAMQKAAKVRE